MLILIANAFSVHHHPRLRRVFSIQQHLRSCMMCHGQSERLQTTDDECRTEIEGGGRAHLVSSPIGRKQWPTNSGGNIVPVRRSSNLGLDAESPPVSTRMRQRDSSKEQAPTGTTDLKVEGVSSDGDEEAMTPEETARWLSRSTSSSSCCPVDETGRLSGTAAAAANPDLVHVATPDLDAVKGSGTGKYRDAGPKLDVADCDSECEMNCGISNHTPVGGVEASGAVHEHGFSITESFKNSDMTPGHRNIRQQAWSTRRDENHSMRAPRRERSSPLVNSNRNKPSPPTFAWPQDDNVGDIAKRTVTYSPGSAGGLQPLRKPKETTTCRPPHRGSFSASLEAAMRASSSALHEQRQTSPSIVSELLQTTSPQSPAHGRLTSASVAPPTLRIPVDVADISQQSGVQQEKVPTGHGSQGLSAPKQCSYRRHPTCPAAWNNNDGWLQV